MPRDLPDLLDYVALEPDASVHRRAGERDDHDRGEDNTRRLGNAEVAGEAPDALGKVPDRPVRSRGEVGVALLPRGGGPEARRNRQKRPQG